MGYNGYEIGIQFANTKKLFNKLVASASASNQIKDQNPQFLINTKVGKI